MNQSLGSRVQTAPRPIYLGEGIWWTPSERTVRSLEILGFRRSEGVSPQMLDAIKRTLTNMRAVSTADSAKRKFLLKRPASAPLQLGRRA